MKQKPSLSVAIMTHPERLELAQELQEHIGAGEITGVEKDTLWGAAQAAWRNHDPDCDYHLVIQDDIWANQTLVDDVRHLLSHFQRSVILSLTDNNPRKKHRWKQSRRANNARALVMPVPMISEWLDWCEQNVFESFKPDDVRLSIFLSERNGVIYYPNPPLVYQRKAPSVYRRRKPYGRDWEFIGDKSVYDYDWTDDIENRIVNRRPQRPMLYDWVTGKMILEYPEGAVFPNNDVINEPNIRPFTSLDMRPSRIASMDGTAIFMPPFYDMPMQEFLLLEAGAYHVNLKARMGHILGGQRRGLLKYAPNDDKIPPGGGAGTIEFWRGQEMLHQMKIGLYFSTSNKIREFSFSVNETTPVGVRIWSHLWGNMAVQFEYNLTRG